MKVIGLTGRKRVGKDTVAKILCERLNLKQIAFADPIRCMLDALPIDPYYKENKLEVIPWLGQTYTELMQSLGTGWGRTLVADNLWILVADRIATKAAEEGYAGLVFSDVRHGNEASYIIATMGGAIYKVVGPLGVVANAHESELPLPEIYIKAEIPNYGDIAKLDETIAELF